jgi:hypothetical protein
VFVFVIDVWFWRKNSEKDFEQFEIEAETEEEAHKTAREKVKQSLKTLLVKQKEK